MIVDEHAVPQPTGIERQACRRRTGRERPASLETEVVVQPAGVVPLDDEDRLLALRLAAERLRRPLRVALPFVVAQAHGRCLTCGGRAAAVWERQKRSRQDQLLQAGGPTLEAGFYPPRVVFGPGEKAV